MDTCEYEEQEEEEEQRARRSSDRSIDVLDVFALTLLVRYHLLS